MINTSPKKIEQVLTKGVEQVLPNKKGLAELMRKKKIRVYFGIDPTSPNIHIGHSVPLQKLREFQLLGHEVILLFGTFTAQIGDPSGRDKRREPLTLTQVNKNIATYKKQAVKILDINKTKIKQNHVWLGKLKFDDLTKIGSNFTISRLLERDMFQNRLKKGQEVWFNELLYPLMQGYDSVAMNVDLEIGGNDQTFNMLVGRKLQQIYNKKQKYILTTEMLIGLDGRKMSKTYGNVVNINDEPNDMFGKIMSLKDGLMIHYFKLCTDLPLSEIEKIKKKLSLKKTNPKTIKLMLAKEITSLYHGKAKAKEAEREFTEVFTKKRLPKKIKEFVFKKGEVTITKLLRATGYVDSVSQAQRLIKQKAVRIDGVLVQDRTAKIHVKKGTIIKIGKRRFARIK